MSVFEKHAREIKTYEVGGVERGHLLFAMAILSDCQEMVRMPPVVEELNEAKELMSSVMVELQSLNGLWACREVVRDGECEYGCEFFVKASSLEEAERKAWECVKENYIYDCEDNDAHPYTDYLNDDGWMEDGGDYRWYKAEVRQEIKSLQDLFSFLHIPSATDS